MPWADEIQDQPTVPADHEAFFVLAAMQVGEPDGYPKYSRFYDLALKTKVPTDGRTEFSSATYINLYREYIVWYAVNQKT